MGERIGYARVSSTSQDLTGQQERLTASGCIKIYQEKYSGATAQRKQLEAVLDYVRDGDTLVITKLDRLARSVTDLGNIAKQLEAKKVDLVVLDQKIDTSTSTGRLMFNMIGAFAQFERDLIRERCQEGIDRAKKAGKKFGRKPKLTPKQLELMKAEFEAAEVPKSVLAAKYGVSRASLYRLVKA